MDSVFFLLQHGNDDLSCKWLLTVGGGGMASAIVFLVVWIRDLSKQLNEEKAGRLTDLKEHYKHTKE